MKNFARRVGVGVVMAVALTAMAAAGGSAAAATVPSADAAPVAHAAEAAACPWLNQRLPVRGRVRMLISSMTLAQKIFEMHVDPLTSTGPYAGYEGYVPAQPDLCIPALPEQDDSLGVAAGANGVTQLPAPVALASAWNPSLAREYGRINGIEHRGKGIAMALGPGVNIQRDPRWGRNFEVFSEDPYLSSRLAVAYVKGLQSAHILADVKHYAAYNQETYRNTNRDDVIVGQRALHEIYLPSFWAAAIKGHAASFMCSYATVNGQPACQNTELLHDILKQRWGAPTFVRSDGGANHSTVASVNAGLVQERGSNYFDNGLLERAADEGLVKTSTINRRVSELFTQMFKADLFNDPPRGNLSKIVTTRAHAAFARAVAEDGTILLKDADHVLPLNPNTVGSIAIIGADGSTSPLTAGGGSSHVVAPYRTSPLMGITRRVGSKITINSYPGNDPAKAAAAARAARIAIVFASQYESEGTDLANIDLPGNQNRIIAAVAKANQNTVVVLDTGGPVVMPWLSQVKGVLEAWYPGQEDGNAIAAVLFGDVDPAGHLPETFPRDLAQIPTHARDEFPGVDDQVHYSNGILVGYRYYDARHITPLFPFGYGLSYTSFQFSDLRVTPRQVDNPLSGPGTTRCGCNGQSAPLVQVSARVTNTGNRAGTEVAQLYVGDPAVAGEPPRQLKGFRRVTLQPGQTRTVRFVLDGHDLSYWDDAVAGWVVPEGAFRVYVGDSSAMNELPLQGSFDVVKSSSAGYAFANRSSRRRRGR